MIHFSTASFCQERSTIDWPSFISSHDKRVSNSRNRQASPLFHIYTLMLIAKEFPDLPHSRQEILQPFITIRVLEKPVELFQGQMFFTWRVGAGNAYTPLCVGMILASFWSQKIPGDQFQRDSSPLVKGQASIAFVGRNCTWNEALWRWRRIEARPTGSQHQ